MDTCPVNERLMDRCAGALAFISEQELHQRLTAEGISPGVAFLAIKAGKLLNDRRNGV